MQIDLPGWRRFGTALMALAVAFVLALYCDVLAHEGNVLGTALAGSAALLLAGYVAVTAVPYLARRTSIEWLRTSVDYHLTREGSLFIGSIFIIAIAALNTGNNMLFLILAAMLAAIVVSGLVSRLVLAGLELSILLPDHVFARQPVLARIRLGNDKRWLASFSISVSGAEAGTGWLRRIRDPEPARTGLLGRGAYFPYLKSLSSAIQSIEVTFPRRGAYRQEHFTISTRFPFGFLEKLIKVPSRYELMVYPAVEPTEEFYEILPLLSGEMESYSRGRGHDLYSIRDYQMGDSARFVDWKASARTAAIKVREYAREDERRVQLVFDRAFEDRGAPLGEGHPRGRAPRASHPAPPDRFERAVEFCAALAWHFYQIDSQLQFVSDGFRTHSGPAREVIFEILRYLALVEPRSSRDGFLQSLGESDSFKIIVTDAPRGSIPTSLWTSSYIVFYERL
jgi:uncharacterized protein (DUF58 family)